MDQERNKEGDPSFTPQCPGVRVDMTIKINSPPRNIFQSLQINQPLTKVPNLRIKMYYNQHGIKFNFVNLRGLRTILVWISSSSGCKSKDNWIEPIKCKMEAINLKFSFTLLKKQFPPFSEYLLFYFLTDSKLAQIEVIPFKKPWGVYLCVYRPTDCCAEGRGASLVCAQN